MEFLVLGLKSLFSDLMQKPGFDIMYLAWVVLGERLRHRIVLLVGMIYFELRKFALKAKVVRKWVGM